MGFLSSLPILSIGGNLFDFTASLLLVVIGLALWVLMLLILHPLHAFLFLAAALCEYAFIYWFEFDIWVYFFVFFAFYALIFALYNFVWRKLFGHPQAITEQLAKLAQLHEDGKLSDEEFEAAKKVLLKL